MFGNANRKVQSYSMMQLALEEDVDDSFLLEEGGRLSSLATDEVNQLAAKAESALFNEREAAARDVCKALHLVDAVGSAPLAEQFFQVVELLGKDGAPSVQCLLLESTITMLSLSRDSPLLNKLALSTLTPILDKALASSVADLVRKSAIGIVGLVLEQQLFPSDTLLHVLLPRLVTIAHEKAVSEECGHARADEQRVEAASVLCRAVASGTVNDKEWIMETFVPPYSHLLADGVFHIRKAAVAILGELCKMFGEAFTVELAIPHVISLCKDEMWGVRKAVCEVFVDIAMYCPLVIRRSLLAPRFVQLLRDPSRWVSYIAFQELGPFISTFANSNITGLMLKDGQVCDQEGPSMMDSHNEKGGRYEGRMLPGGCFIPELLEEEKEEVDEEEQTVGLEQLLGELYEKGKEEKGVAQRWKSEETLIGGNGVSSKCHSLDDLSKIGLDSTIRAEEDEEEEDIVSEREDLLGHSPPSQSDESFYSNIFWSNYAVTEDVCIVPFGSTPPASPVARKREQFMEKRMDLLSIEEKEEEKKMEKSKGKSPEKKKNEDETEEIVPPKLVEHFVKMVSGPAADADMNRQCAHNFPAVAFTLGRKNWKDLRETYKLLAGDHQWRVRVSLAHSMHEMAAIVGSETAEKDLLPVFDALREDVDEVRGGLLKHLADFYASLPPPSRVEMLSKLPHFLRVDRECETNWRFRLEFAKQCTRLCDLYDVDCINKIIAGIALTLATDRVSDVRGEAANLMAKILSLMVEAEWEKEVDSDESSDEDTKMPLTDSFVMDIVKGFARSQRWARRQTFLHMTEHCRRSLSPSQFSSLLLSHILPLANDAVPNVRIVVARVLTPPPEGMPWKSQAMVVLKKLADENDMDVSRQARLALGCDPSKELIDVSLRAYRIAEKESIFLDSRSVHDSSDMSISPNTSFNGGSTA